MSWWEVTCEPRPEQYGPDGEERAPAGIVVYVTDGKVKSVVGRVAWSRWPLRRLLHGSFAHSLRNVVNRAQAEAIMLNAGLVEAGEAEGLVSATPPPSFGSED